MPKVFVVNATAPRGGGYMAYHIGRLIHKHYGYEFVDVPTLNFGKAIFSYDVPMWRMSREEMEKTISENDVLVCNPSAASAHMFGLRLPGKKIMYVQGFRTFRYLDCNYDVYACVSSVVQNFLKVTYGVDAPIIPPFIELEQMPEVISWSDRPDHSALVYIKKDMPDDRHVYKWIKNQFAKYYPELQTNKLLFSSEVSHKEFLSLLGSVRYLINTSVAEGFGLVPLEAMGMGTIPVGLDGLSGRDYMQYGQNSVCLSFRQLQEYGMGPLVLDMKSFNIKHSLINSTPKDFNKQIFYTRWQSLLGGLL